MILTQQVIPPAIHMDSSTGNVTITSGTIILQDGVELTRLYENSYFTPDKMDEAKECFGDSIPGSGAVMDALAALPVSLAYIADIASITPPLSEIPS